MRLLVDGRPLVGARTGIGVHVAEIASRLEAEVIVAAHAPVEDRSLLEGRQFEIGGAPIGVAWQQFQLPRVAERVGADAVWGPHSTLPWTLRPPAVVTVHDLTSITMPGAHKLRTILSFNTFIGHSLGLAKRIASVSRMTAGQIMSWFGVPASKIEVVPNGVSRFFRSAGEAREDFVLYTGTLEPRKGIGDLLRAWRSLPRPRPRLLLAGAPGWRMGPIPDAEVLGYVSRERLRELYSRCLAFVYPSRYEGFGLPPLEAMACGAPVITTRGGAIPEVVGDAALLVAPGDSAALHEALRRLILDPQLRAELSERGRARAAQFTWERSAALFEELLRDLR